MSAKAKQQNGYLSPDDQASLDAAKQQMDLWGEGGAARALLHGATQGVLAWIGGGFSLDAGLRGAGGAIAASYLAPLIVKEAQAFLNDAGLDNAAKPGPLAGLIGQLAITGLGSAFGNMAAVTAASVTINNYLTHAQIEKEIEELLACNHVRSCVDGVVAKYNIVNDIQEDAFRGCTTQTCIAGALAAINEELPALRKDVQALINAGCDTCLAQYGFNSPQHAAENVFVVNYCANVGGPNCISVAQHIVASRNIDQLAAIVFLPGLAGEALSLSSAAKIGAGWGSGGYVVHQLASNEPISAEGILISGAAGAAFGQLWSVAPWTALGVGSVLTAGNTIALAPNLENFWSLSAHDQQKTLVDLGFTIAGQYGLFAGGVSLAARTISAAATEAGAQPWAINLGSLRVLPIEGDAGAQAPQLSYSTRLLANEGGTALVPVNPAPGGLAADMLRPFIGGLPAAASSAATSAIIAESLTTATASPAAGTIPSLWVNCCFVAGTPVKTETGHAPIESLKVGDLVQSEDTKTGAISLRRVTQVHVRPIEKINTFYKLTVSKDGAEEDFYVSGEHPFWIADKAEWKSVDELSVGDALADFGGQRLRVSAKAAVSEKQQTYNISVEGNATYFAGRSEVLVHNADNCGRLPVGYAINADGRP